jgi:cyclopropane fatty-acyl-phospholipid synthase-like methyltransferase
VRAGAIETRGGGYDSIYSGFDSPLMRQVRRESYGEDIGQHSWVSADELRRDLASLRLSASTRLLDLGCGVGGPLTFAMRETGCWATGLDASEPALASARERARGLGVEQRIRLVKADLNEPLVLPAKLFEAAISLDVILHLRDRLELFGEVARVLVPGGRFLFTDAGVLTGTISDAEALHRSLHAPIQFHPPGFDERALETAGFRVLEIEDRSAAQAALAEARHGARLAHRAELEPIEGDEFELHQRYLETVIEISRRGAVARRMFLAEKP